MSIILVRLSPASWSYGSSLSSARHCRVDPSSAQHGAYVDDEGVFHYQHIDTASSTTTTLLRFQLQYRAEDALDYEPVNTPWLFEFVPGAPGDLLLVQQGSCRILYASLPKQGVDSSGVFLFGSHTAPVRCLSCNGNVLLSGCQGGMLKLWRLSDGQLADTCSLPDKSSVTCITSLGPLLVAAGSSSSTVTLYDLASGRLLAVQCLLAGPGSVQAMAAWVPPQLLAQANLAPGGPLAPDGGGVLTAAGLGGFGLEAEHECAGPARAGVWPLLAVASSSGWLCIFCPGQHPHQPWCSLHSTGSLIAPGASTQLAFSPDGATLAVASPVAQVLGTDAVAVAAAGGQPGAVSLYEVARAGGTVSAMVPPLLLEQEQRAQLPELQLWHQWGLSSTPVGLAVLPGSGMELMHGKQLQPGQVLRLYVVPAIGPAQVLHAVRKLKLPSSSTHSTSQHETVPVTALPATHLAPYDAAAASHSREMPGQHSAAAEHASPTSSSSQHEDVDDALLLNIAERDLADVATAIAAAAGPCLDAELSQLLAGASARYAAPAAGASHGVAAASGSEAAAPAAEPSTGASSAQHSSGQQADTGADFEPYAADASTGAPAAAAAGGAAFRLPQTLPVARRWQEPHSASAGQRHLQQDLTALAKALQEEQELMRQEQQQAMAQEQQQAMQQEEQQAMQQQQQQQAAGVASQGHGQRSARDRPSAVEQELPSESSFQHLLQQQASQQELGSQHTQQVHTMADEQQQQSKHPQAEVQRQSQQTADHQSSRPHPEATRAGGPAGGNAAGSSQSMGSTPAPAAAYPAADASGPSTRDEADPQPRKLPAMLRSQQHPAAGVMAAGSAAGAAAAASASSSAKPATNAAGAQASPTARRVDVTLLGAAQTTAAGAAAPAAAVASQQAVPGLLQQQGQHFQQGAQDQPTQPPGRLSVQERLALRRQQLLAQKQQQQQKQARNLAAAVQVAHAGVVQRSAALMPASDHPLAAAVENSSRLLAAKIQELEQLPDVRVDPAGPAALKVAAARLADLDLGPDQQQYCYEELPDLRDVPTPTQAPRLVPKQLDAHWVASRSLQPSMDTLFKPQDWQQGFVDPQLLLLPAWPTPEQVVGQLLWPGQRPGAWT